MEITLEKIELVKDRTGVSYKEAKEALEAADGSVVDAIISIEEQIDEKSKGKFTGYAGSVVEKLKEIVKKGNISKITVKKDDEIILNLPLNAGIVGAVIAPVATVAGVVAAFGTKCKIEVVKDDGTVIDVNEMALDAKDELVVKGSELAEEMKAKSAEFYDVVKEKSADAYEAVKEKAQDVMNRDDKCSCCGCDEDCCIEGCDADEECNCESECTECEDVCASCEADDCENCNK